MNEVVSGRDKITQGILTRWFLEARCCDVKGNVVRMTLSGLLHEVVRFNEQQSKHEWLSNHAAL